MRLPPWIFTAAAVTVALPFGWSVGVLVAYLAVGPDFGQLPVLTVPISIVAALIFSLSPVLTAGKRLAIMAAGTALLALLSL